MNYQLTKKKFLNDEEQSSLDVTLKKFLTSDIRNVAVLTALLNTGARPTELLRVKVSDLDPEKKTVFIHGLKGSRDREIPLSDQVWNLVNHQAKGKAPGDQVFDLALRTLQTVWSNYRPVKKGVRCLRHTFALKLYQKTKDIRLVQLALGHKSINNTMVYADFVYNQEQLRRLLL